MTSQWWFVLVILSAFCEFTCCSFPYLSGLLHWNWGSRIIVWMAMKYPWSIGVKSNAIESWQKRTVRMRLGFRLRLRPNSFNIHYCKTYYSNRHTKFIFRKHKYTDNPSAWDISSWWRLDMGTCSVLLVICVRNPPVTSGLPSHRTMQCNKSFAVSVYMLLNKQSYHRWCWTHANTHSGI